MCLCAYVLMCLCAYVLMRVSAYVRACLCAYVRTCLCAWGTTINCISILLFLYVIVQVCMHWVFHIYTGRNICPINQADNLLRGLPIYAFMILQMAHVHYQHVCQLTSLCVCVFDTMMSGDIYICVCVCV
jgi:hypothetical protein